MPFLEPSSTFQKITEITQAASLPQQDKNQDIKGKRFIIYCNFILIYPKT